MSPPRRSEIATPTCTALAGWKPPSVAMETVEFRIALHRAGDRLEQQYGGSSRSSMPRLAFSPSSHAIAFAIGIVSPR